MIKNRFLKILLYPISFIYGKIISIRNLIYDLKIIKPVDFNAHIINIGNLSVGGTGKTPIVEYIVELLLKEDVNVTVISRGYKRKLGGLTVATKNPKWQIIGDEPTQIKTKFPEINVVVCANRIKAINYTINNLFDKHKKNVIILDDAFQYKKIYGTFNILLIDANIPIYEDYYIPSGTLRDNPSQKSKANIIIFTKCKKDYNSMEKRIFKDKMKLLSFQKLYFSKIKYLDLKPAFSPSFVLKLKNISPAYHILLVTAIANPVYLYNFLKTLTPNITHLKYQDHHEFTENDIIDIYNYFGKIKTPKRLIITTEKDLMRLKTTQGIEFLKDKPVYYLPIKNVFLTEEEKLMFNRQILDYVRKNFTIS